MLTAPGMLKTRTTRITQSTDTASQQTTTLRGFCCNQATDKDVNILVDSGSPALAHCSFGEHLYSMEFEFANGFRWIPQLAFVENDVLLTPAHIALAVKNKYYTPLRLVMLENEPYLNKTPAQALADFTPIQAAWLEQDPDAKFIIAAGGVFPNNDQSFHAAKSWGLRLWKLIPVGWQRQSIAGFHVHIYPNPYFNLRQYFNAEAAYVADRWGGTRFLSVSEVGCPDDVVAPNYNPKNVHAKCAEAGIHSWFWYKQDRSGNASNYRCLLAGGDKLTPDGALFAAL